MSTDWNSAEVDFKNYVGGEADAVKPLFEFLASKIRGRFLAKGCSQEDAADLVQTVLLKIHVHRESYDGTRSLKAWVITVAERSLIDFWRKRKLTEAADDPDTITAENASPLRITEYRQELEQLGKRMEKLKPVDREIVGLYAGGGLSMREIGERIGMSPLAVRLRLFRARHALKVAELLMLAVVFGGIFYDFR